MSLNLFFIILLPSLPSFDALCFQLLGFIHLSIHWDIDINRAITIERIVCATVIIK